MLIIKSEFDIWLEPNSALEEGLFFCSGFAFLNPDLAGQFQTKMYHLLGHENYARWTALLTYVKTCHLRVETYPELSYEAEKRVQENLGPLLQNEPRLADFFRSYSEIVKCERQSQKEKLAADLAERKQVEEQLRTRSH